MINIALSNSLTKAKRQSFGAENHFSIIDLQSMPHLFDWVTCNTGLNTFQMFLGGKDDGVAMRFFWNGFYEKHSLKLWTELAAEQSDFILDIGAHTGCYTLAASTKNKNVISFEPHFMNFSRLNLNLRANSFNTKNSFMLCVGNQNVTVPFSTSSSMDYLTSGGSVGERKNAYTTYVQQVALDNFLPLDIIRKISLIKIDVEGYEPNVLNGMKKILDNKPTIFFECIEEKSSRLVQEILIKYKYRFYEIDDLNETIKEVKILTPHFDANNMLLMHKINRLATLNNQF